MTVLLEAELTNGELRDSLEPRGSSVPLAKPTGIVPNKWYGIIESRAVKKKPVAIQRMGENLVLYRDSKGGIVCMLNRCPHRGMELTQGRIFGDEIECPFHAFRFRPDGQCSLMPCEGSNAAIPKTMATIAFPAREKHGIIWIWWGAKPEDLGWQALPDIPWQEHLPDTPYQSTESFLWPLPHHRVIENSIDGHHAPALHGNRRGVRGWKIKGLGRRMYTERLDIESVPGGLNSLYVFSDETNLEGEPFKTGMYYREPGMVYAVINGGLHILTVDSPIDEHTSWRIVRYFNTVAKIPLLGHAVVWLMRNVDQRAVQWHEDHWIISKQQYEIPGVQTDHYIRSDRLIAMYYAMQKRLVREARQKSNILPPIVLRHL